MGRDMSQQVRMMSVFAFISLLLPSISVWGEEATAISASERSSRGQAIYKARCTICHNSDPSAEGKVGPAVAKAGFALLEAKIVQKSYPAGYQPKRPSEMMPAMNLSKEDLLALEAFLGN